jgi:osmotically inducible lipoprotein OsmB
MTHHGPIRSIIPLILLALFAVSGLAGCQTYAGQGSLLGGLGGAGLGALVGSASGHSGAGAAIGAAAGALGGAAVGGALDDIDAKNRAQIAAQMGRAPAPGAVNVSDVVAMQRAGVNDQLIINHLNANGLARPLQANDIIYLQQNGINPGIIDAMQRTKVAMAQPAGPVVVAGPPPPSTVVVASPGFYYGPHWGYYRRGGW